VKLLVLGGTRFLGRHVVETAAAEGHAVTLFHRGETRCPLPPGVEERLGDRTSADVERLGAEPWDLVVDTSGMDPETVERSARALAGARRYLFVSTVSVYADVSRPGLSEDAPLAGLPAEGGEADPAQRYGALKAAAEAVVRERFGARATVVRPGLIAGPYDPTGRFTYWAERLVRGGEVLAPGRPERPVQLIDARDLAAWFLRLGRAERGGTFHAAGPLGGTTMGELLEAGTAALDPAEPVRLRWVGDEVLLGAGAGPWMELPLWLPDQPEYAGFLRLDPSRARAAGLTTRPVGETFRATAAWAASLPPERERGAGLSPERERELLAAGQEVGR
jgi:2'-hydroxyisoflavone reductase